MTQVVTKLIERQQQAGEADREFAGRLGLSRQAWQKIRTGECGLGPRSLAGIIRAYPELSSDAQASFLGENASALAADANQFADSDSPSQRDSSINNVADADAPPAVNGHSRASQRQSA